MKDFSRQAVRFLLVGGINTAVSYLTYIGLSGFFPATIAYAAAYACGVLMSFLANGKYVFRSKGGVKMLLPYFVMQVCLLAFGTAVTHLCEVNRVEIWLAGLVAIAVMVPISFLANRWFFLSRTSVRAGPTKDASG